MTGEVLTWARRNKDRDLWRSGLWARGRRGEVGISGLWAGFVHPCNLTIYVRLYRWICMYKRINRECMCLIQKRTYARMVCMFVIMYVCMRVCIHISIHTCIYKHLQVVSQAADVWHVQGSLLTCSHPGVDRI